MFIRKRQENDWKKNIRKLIKIKNPRWNMINTRWDLNSEVSLLIGQITK